MPICATDLDRKQLRRSQALSRPRHERRRYALYFAQYGVKHKSAKPLKGFAGAGVLEIVESFEGNAYRAVYTVRLKHAVYVLHCFQKSHKDGKVAKLEQELIESRLRDAMALDRSKDGQKD